jgi:hypothetical protein
MLQTDYPVVEREDDDLLVDRCCGSEVTAAAKLTRLPKMRIYENMRSKGI